MKDIVLVKKAYRTQYLKHPICYNIIFCFWFRADNITQICIFLEFHNYEKHFFAIQRFPKVINNCDDIWMTLNLQYSCFFLNFFDSLLILNRNYLKCHIESRFNVKSFETMNIRSGLNQVFFLVVTKTIFNFDCFV